MIYNYLKLACRILIRNPFFSLINVLGLAVGFASFFGLWSYAITELKSDQYHKDHERIAQIVTDWRWTDDNVNWGHMVIPASLTSTLPRVKKDFPQVEDFVRMRPVTALLSRPNSDQIYKEGQIVYADKNVFNFFTIPLILGNAGDVLAMPNSIVLSHKAAKKFFGDQHPLDQVMLLNGTTELKVTGVFENLPSNTHLEFEYVLSNEQVLNEWNSVAHGWAANGWSRNYVRLRDADILDFEKVLNTRIHSYWAEAFVAMPRVKAKAKVRALTDIAFTENNSYWEPYIKSRPTLRFLGGVGLAVLVMSWINYINLTISRTTRRIAEVATRKISGAAAIDLVRQFVMESALVMLLAVALAITFLQLARSPLEIFLKVKSQDWLEIDPDMILFFVAVVVLGMLITGLYPAIVSHRTSPTKLFSSFSKKSAKAILPSFLTTTQYVIAIVSTFLALIIHQQLTFIYHQDLGFDKTNVYFVNPAMRKSEHHTQELRTFMDHVSTFPGVKSAMITSQLINLPIRNSATSDMLFLDGVLTEENFVNFFKHKLIAGRDFVKDDRNDVVILTQHAVERIGYNVSNAIGQRIFVGEPEEQKEIIGVIENFRLMSFMRTDNSEASTGRGTVLIHRQASSSPADVLVLKVENKQAVADVEAAYKISFPDNVFNGFYFEDVLFNAYAGEQVLRTQLSFFTMLIIGIACLGLLGMVANRVVEKTREIGIRKVLGAGSVNILQVLLSSTMRQITAATVIGLTVSYYMSQQYLDRFLERISLQFIHFGIPVIVVLVILGSSIAGILYRVIRTNPVDSIRHN